MYGQENVKKNAQCRIPEDSDNDGLTIRGDSILVSRRKCGLNYDVSLVGCDSWLFESEFSFNILSQNGPNH